MIFFFSEHHEASDHRYSGKGEDDRDEHLLRYAGELVDLCAAFVGHVAQATQRLEMIVGCLCVFGWRGGYGERGVCVLHHMRAVVEESLCVHVRLVYGSVSIVMR